MKTRKEVGESVFSVFGEDIFDEGKIDMDFEREEVFASLMNLNILSDRACYDGKDDHTKGYDHCSGSGFRSFEINVFKKQIDGWEEDC